MIKTLKYVEALLLIFTFLLFLILPQINRSGYVQSTVTSKLICFIYSCLLLFGFYLLRVLITKKVVLFISKLDIALLLLITYIALNRYIIQPHFGFSIRYMELLGLSVLYVILRSFSLKYCLWILLAIVISGIIQAVYGNLQLLGYYASNHSGFKMTGSFFNPGPYAGFLVSVWSVALGMYLFKDKIIAQQQSQTKSKSFLLNIFIEQAFEYIPLLGLICIFIVLPATQSRAAWLAAIASSLVLMEYRYGILKSFLKKAEVFKRILLIVLCISVFCAGFFGMYHFKKNSSDGRAFIWKVTTQMIADAPTFGVGFDLFKAHYMNYQAHYFATKGETLEAMIADNTYYAFNEFLQFIAENGLLGFIFLTITILVLFKVKVIEDYKYLSPIVKTGLFSIGAFACFSYPMQILPIKLVLLVLLSLLSNTTVDYFHLKIGENQRKLCVYKILALLLACVSIYQTFSFTERLSKGFISWENALSRHQYGDYTAAILEFESVYPIFEKDGDFLMNYGKTLSMVDNPLKAISVLEQSKNYQNNTVISTALGDCYKAIKQYDKSEVAYQQAVNMVPSKFYSNYLLAKLYDSLGQEEKAIALAKKLMNKKIKIPSTAIKEMREEMKGILLKYKNPLGFKN